MGEEPEDAELVERARGGDEAAFRVLHDRYAAGLFARVRRRLPAVLRRRVAESDIVQEVFAVAFRRLGAFRGSDHGAFAHWIGRIADRKVNETLRYHFDAEKRAAAREFADERRPATGEFEAKGPTPSAVAMGKELDAALANGLANLPEDYRTVLRLVHEEGLRLADAGERMGRSPEAVRKLYGRALSVLSESVFGQGRA